MFRLILLLSLVCAGCQRSVEVVLTYAPASDTGDDEEGNSVDMSRVLSVVQRRLRYSQLPCRVSLDKSQDVRIEVFGDSTEQEVRDLVTVLNSGELEVELVRVKIEHTVVRE